VRRSATDLTADRTELNLNDIKKGRKPPSLDCLVDAAALAAVHREKSS